MCVRQKHSASDKNKAHTKMKTHIITLQHSDFASMQACGDAAHLLAVSTGALVLIMVRGSRYAECFGYGIRAEEVPYVPYFSGFVS